MPHESLNQAIRLLPVFGDSIPRSACFLAVSECFYDDEHHGDEEDAEDGSDGRTENDGNPHSDSA